MKFPELAYIEWAKSLPRVDVNLARSGVALCPSSLLRLTASDLVATLPVKYGYAPLRDAIAARYDTRREQVFAVSGGTSYANWLACLAVLDGCGPGTEVIVERPTYEPLLKIPRALGFRVRRLDRRFEDGYAVDLDRFASLVTAKTRLAVVTNLHNPSGVRIPMATLRAMAAMLARVKGVSAGGRGLPGMPLPQPSRFVRARGAERADDQQPDEGLRARRPASRVDPRAVGVDSPRPADQRSDDQQQRRGGRADGARRVPASSRPRPAGHGILDPNLARVRAFFAREPRLRAVLPEGGNVVFPRLPAAIDSDRLVRHLVKSASTLVVPGRFFEAPRHIRVSFGCSPSLLGRGLANLSRALDDLS